MIEFFLRPQEYLHLGDDPGPLSLCPTRIPRNISDSAPSIFLPSMASDLYTEAFQLASAPLGPFPYPVNIGEEPTYLGLGGHEGGPGHHFPVLVPLHILPHIVNIFDEPFYGLRPGIDIYFLTLSLHHLRLIKYPYERLRPVPGVSHLHLGQPKPLPNTPPLPQQAIKPPLQLHGH